MGSVDELCNSLGAELTVQLISIDWLLPNADLYTVWLH